MNKPNKEMPEEPILAGRQPSDESKRILALRDEIEKSQLTFLDESAKRIVELVTLLLGLLFGALTLSDKFPPPYLTQAAAKAGAVATLALYVMALLLAVLAMTPRKLARYENNVTQQRNEIERIASTKLAWFRASAVVFVLATLMLAILIGAIVLQA